GLDLVAVEDLTARSDGAPLPGQDAEGPMSDIPAESAEHELEKGNWGEIFRDGLGLYSALVIGGIAMHATQMLVIAIIMPTIVADIGAAIAGVVASTAGLGAATEPQAVDHAVTTVYLFCWVPFGLAAIFMFRFIRYALPRPASAPSLAD